MSNQTTNLIQFKNHTDDQKAEFDFENYAYEWQQGLEWSEITNTRFKARDAAGEDVFRLKIEPEKWYILSEDMVTPDEDDIEIVQGCKIIGDYSRLLTYLRPAKPNEIPQPETLEDKIKTKWPEYEVVMLEWDDRNRWVMPDSYLHIDAQSMKGWHKYVFFNTETNKLYALRDTHDFKNNVTTMPVAVLFSGVQS